MNRSATIFLQIVIVLIGIGALAILLFEPHVEGRNANATLFQIYFNDPFLAYAYVSSIAFFVGLYQAFKLLGYAGKKSDIFVVSGESIANDKILRDSRYLFVVGAEIFILLNAEEDKPPGIMIGVVIAFCSIVVAAAAAMFERILQNAVDIKSENDLTV